MISDRVVWKSEWSIHRFRDPEGRIAGLLRAGARLEDVAAEYPELFRGAEAFRSNVALTEGLQELIDLICGIGAPVKWDNGNAHLGVGDSPTEENPAQTGLLAAVNKLYKDMDATYPQKSGQTAEWRSTFGSSDANYAWEEYTVSNTDANEGKNLNRKIASKGTKVSGETWTLSLKVTFS